MIKNIPRSLRVVGDRRSLFARGQLASGFVAAHVWREVRLEQLASRDPRLNSFIPNLVWLPRQIAKLSDHEGGVIQSALKQLSLDIYRDVSVAPGLKRRVDEIWDLLPPPRRPRVTGTHELNFFQPTDRFIRTRRGAISQATALLEAALRGAARLPKGRLPSRYVAGLPGISAGKLSEVLETVRALSPPAD